MAAAHWLFVADQTVIYLKFTVDPIDFHRILENNFPELEALSKLLQMSLSYVSCL